MIPILTSITDWYCPNCKLGTQTKGFVANRYHHCPKLSLTAPLIRQGTKAKVEAVQRQDYTGPNPLIPSSRRRDPTGKPVRAIPRVMNVTTTRDNGTDVLVFAPTAVGRIGR